MYKNFAKSKEISLDVLKFYEISVKCVTTDLKGGPPQSQGHKNFGKTFAWACMECGFFMTHVRDCKNSIILSI